MLEKKIQEGLEDLNFEQVQFEIHLRKRKNMPKMASMMWNSGSRLIRDSR